jgi:hypothetical protein
VYLLLNFGDFIDGSTSNIAAPFVQLLSTTDPAAAHADFVATRLGGHDTSRVHLGNPKGTGSRHSSRFSRSKIPIIIGAGVVLAAVLVGIVFLVRRRRKAMYRPLFEPAPQGDTQLHHVSGYNTGGQYADPWNRQG